MKHEDKTSYTTQSQEERIDAILTKTIVKNKETSWAEIVKAVSKEMEIKNWLDVRGILQFQINEGEIKRTDSIKVEHYIRLK